MTRPADIDRDRRVALALSVVVVAVWAGMLATFLTQPQGAVAAVTIAVMGVAIVVLMAACAVLIKRDVRRNGGSPREANAALAASFLFWPLGLALWRRSRRGSGRRVVGWWWLILGILVALARS